MTKKRKQPDVPQRPEDCKTIRQQVAYSLRLRELYEEQVCGPGWSSPPSALTDFYDAHPVIESMPWTSVTFAEEWAARERTRRAIVRMLPGDE
jgi:hypothetical protein